MKKIYLLLVALCLSTVVWAGSIDVTVTAASTANTLASATNQAILRVAVLNDNGGGQGTETITAMAFTAVNTNNASVTNAKLYYTTTNTFATGTQLGATDVNVADGISFSFSQAMAKGSTYYYWLSYDIAAGAATCDVFNASQVQADITTGATIATYTFTAGAGRKIVGIGCQDYCAGGSAGTYSAFVTKVDFATFSRESAYGSGTSGYVFASETAEVQRTVAYNLSITTQNGYNSSIPGFIAAWFDWNNDGDFVDAGEQAFSTVNVTNSGSTTQILTNTQSITIPAGAVLGNTRMRVGYIGNGLTVGPCNTGVFAEYEDYTITILAAPVAMSYVSSTVTQTNTATVGAGLTTQEVIGIQIVTDGDLSPLVSGNFTFTTAGTTNTADISNAKLFYTGTSGVFATSNQRGSTIAAPGAGFTINSGTTLSKGTNYFWLTYDVNVAATGGNLIDAVCSAVVVGSSRTPTVTAPAGSRMITAASAMTYVSSTTKQVDDVLQKGNTNQAVLRLEVVTSGFLTPLTVTLVNAATTGTTDAATDIVNAKLWSTGTNSSYTGATQLGTTVAAPNGAFSFNLAGSPFALSNGSNYFWISYDITNTGSTTCIDNVATPTNGAVDAVCSSVTVGGVSRTPTVTAPSGYRPIACGGAFYSFDTGLPANRLTSWRSERDGSGSTPASFAVGTTFYVQKGHDMITDGTATIPTLVVEGGGSVTAGHLITMTDLRISGNAVYEQTTNATSATYISNFIIANDGTWVHNNSGFLPGQNRFFSAASNQWFYKVGGGTFPASTNWGNILFDISTVGNFNISNAINTIQGNWEIRRTGGASNYYTMGNTETYTVGGNFIMSGGSLRGTSGVGAAFTVTMNIAGGMTISGGDFRDYFSGSNSNGTIYNVAGDVNIVGGTANLNSSPGGISTFNLTGTTASSWNQTGGTITLPNTNVAAGKTVTLTGTSMGNIATGRTITVPATSTLNCGTASVTGAGTFSLAANATLGIGSPSGITAAPTASGNIQTTTRTLNAGAKYRYYGSSAQVTGDGLPTPLNAATSALIIDHSGSGVTLTRATTISSTGTLTLTTGQLITTTTNIITIDVSATATSAGTSTFVSGPMLKNTNTTGLFTFPVGKGSTRMQIGVQPSGTGAATYSAEYFASPYANTTTFDLTQGTRTIQTISTVEHWMLDRTAGTTSARATLHWNSASNVGSMASILTNLTVARWTGSAWQNTQTSANATITGDATSGSVATTDYIPNFSPFTVASIETVLPIKIISFRGTRRGEQNELKWTIARDREENATFIVERSADNKNFVAMKEPVLTADGISDYTLTDNDEIVAKAPVLYYRLKMKENNGSESYSASVAIHAAKQLFGVKAYPNSFANNFTVAIEQPFEDKVPVDVTLVDVQGREIFRNAYDAEKGTTLLDINTPAEIATGVYFLKVHTPYTQKMVRMVKEQ